MSAAKKKAKPSTDNDGVEIEIVQDASAELDAMVLAVEDLRGLAEIGCTEPEHFERVMTHLRKARNALQIGIGRYNTRPQ